MRERDYQTKLIKKIESLLPSCVILKNDTEYQQGMLDLLILFEDKWAMLEVKRSARAPQQPNQGYYVDLFDDMSFAAFIYPENEEDVLRDLQYTLQTGRSTRVS